MFNKFILFLCVVFLFSVNLLAQQTFNVKVIGVVDGDTLTVITKDKRQLMFRLIGIDAPEREQDFDGNARQFLADLVLNQTVTISNVKKDCLDRLTATVTFKNTDLSLSVVKTGNAWADSSCQIDEMLTKEELAAKEKKIGLWKNPNAVKPSDFIKQRQEQEQLQQAKMRQPSERRIFTGLAPIPPPPRDGLYIGMTVDSFKAKCGDNGKMSKLYTAEGYQSFDLTVTEPKEGSKGCTGSFSFKRTSNNAPFQLNYAFQTL